MSSAELHLKCVLGMNGDLANSLWVSSENHVVYSAGSYIVCTSMSTRKQSFTSASENGLGITAVTVSKCRRFCAFAERSDPGQITVFDIKANKRINTFSTRQSGSSYVSLSFSSDGRVLLAHSGGPEWNLICWDWEKGVSLGATQTADNPNLKISQASFSPLQNDLMCVTGESTLLCYQMQEHFFHPLPISLGTRHDQTVLFHCWLLTNEPTLLVSLNRGEVLLYQNYNAKDTVPGVEPEDSVTMIIPYSRGFITGSTRGKLIIYDYRDFEGIRIVRTIEPETLGSIVGLGLTNDEETLVFSTATNQLLQLSLLESGPIRTAEHILAEFHGKDEDGSSEINDLDVCTRKTIVVTSGQDRTIRLWDYNYNTLLFSKQCADIPLGIAIHPMSIYLLAGFSDRLILFNVLYSDLSPITTYPIKCVTICRFSHRGHLFAAASGSTIYVFSTFTGATLHTCKVHTAKVSSLFFDPNDYYLISSGVDGGVYQWDLKTMDRAGEFVQKSVAFFGAVCNSALNHIYAVSDDMRIKDIELITSAEHTRVDAPASYNKIILSNSHKAIVVPVWRRGEPGDIHLYRIPLSSHFLRYPVTPGSVTGLSFSHDDQFVFVSSSDGVLFIFKCQESDGSSLFEERINQIPKSYEVLVTSLELKEQAELITDLQNKVDELVLQNDYQIRLNELNFAESKKNLTTKYSDQLEDRRSKLRELTQRKAQMEAEYKRKEQELRASHHKTVQEQEGAYQQKIMTEIEKYQKLVIERSNRKKRTDDIQKRLTAAHETEIASVAEDYEHKLESKRAYKSRLRGEIQEVMNEGEETIRQMEEDIDALIENLKTKLQSDLIKNQQLTLKYQGENGMMNKKITSLKNDIEKQRRDVLGLQEKDVKLKTQIDGLSQEVLSLKQAIRNRDSAIGEKEKKIYELKRQNQELEKFKFVLDYKIKELKRQIEPREQEISSMKEQIKEMDKELELYHKSNGELDVKIESLKQELNKYQESLITSSLQRQNAASIVYSIQGALLHCSKIIQHPDKLKRAFDSLYSKYSKAFSSPPEIEKSVLSQIDRQESYLADELETLKIKLVDHVNSHEKDNTELMQKNMLLIKEVTELRTTIEEIRRTRKRREVLGLDISQKGSANIPATAESLRILDAQSEYINYLQDKLAEMDHLK